MAYIINASYIDNGTVCDSTDYRSLGEWCGYEFATEAAADDVRDTLEHDGDVAGVTYTVEDIGITEDEVARKSGDEWWAIMVGSQTPAEFMAPESDDARTVAMAYLSSSPVVGEFKDESAKSDLADKLAEVIEAQSLASQWASLVDDAAGDYGVTDDCEIVLDHNDGGGWSTWLSMRDGAVVICDNGDENIYPFSTLSQAIAGLNPWPAKCCECGRGCDLGLEDNLGRNRCEDCDQAMQDDCF